MPTNHNIQVPIITGMHALLTYSPDEEAVGSDGLICLVLGVPGARRGALCLLRRLATVRGRDGKHQVVRLQQTTGQAASGKLAQLEHTGNDWPLMLTKPGQQGGAILCTNGNADSPKPSRRRAESCLQHV